MTWLETVRAALGGKAEEIICTGQATIKAAEGDKKLPSFEMVAYTGGALEQGWLSYPIVVDLAGLKAGAVNPILADHDPMRRVGHSTEVDNNGKCLKVMGTVSGTGKDAQEVVQDAKNGFPWQASIRARVMRRETVEAGAEVQVNGQTFNGPLYVARESKLVEVSFVALGADSETTAKVAASANSGKESDMKFEEWVKAKGLDMSKLSESEVSAQRLLYDAEIKAKDTKPPAGDVTAELQKSREIMAAEVKRVAAIQAACKPQHAEIAAKAITEGWDVERVKQAVELHDLRAARPQAPGVIVRNGGNADAKTIEAALCLRHSVGNDTFLLAQYGAETMNKANDIRHVPFRKHVENLTARAGVTLPVNENSDEYIRAAFSTNELSGITGNVANKALAASFTAKPGTVPAIAAKRSHTNFLTHTVYSLAINGELKPVAPDGELKHLSLSEESWTRAVDTRGAILRITRKDIVNDELGAFLSNATIMGNKSYDAREKAGFTLLNATGNGSSFFTSANKNYISGSTTNLSTAGLTAAEQKFLDQTGPDGSPVNVVPSILLVPSGLIRTAKDLMKGTGVVVTALASTSVKAVEPNVNSFAGEFTPLTSPYMSNATIPGYSTTAWYLLADPNTAPVMEIAYLNGVEMPTVEYFGLSADASTLGVSWRVYFDFGVNLAEYRAGVKSKGIA